MGIVSIRLGADDLTAAQAFYDATFDTLGVPPSDSPAGYPVAIWRIPGGPVFIVGKPLDGNAATHANGGTILFDAADRAAVDAWHAAVLANGGTCEGPPAEKPQAGGAYGAYARDPTGNKLSVYCGLQFG